MRRRLWRAFSWLVYGIFYPLIVLESWRFRREQAKRFGRFSRRSGGADTKGGE